MAAQTPAQRAANQAYHRREEAKMGKRSSKPQSGKDAAKAPRKAAPKRKSKGFSLPMSKTAFVFLLFAVCGGAVVQILYLLSSVSN